jgi:hypothetical protein
LAALIAIVIAIVRVRLRKREGFTQVVLISTTSLIVIGVAIAMM